MHRYFLWFDTSGITSRPASATISFDVQLAGSGDSILVRSTAFGGNGTAALANGDYDAITGFSSGADMDGNVTDYSAKLGNNAANPLVHTLTNDALDDMTDNDYLIVCMVNWKFDYKNDNSSLPGDASYDLNISTADHGTASKRPTLDYTLAGYGNQVSGIGNSNIAAIDGILTANIGTVIGV